MLGFGRRHVSNHARKQGGVTRFSQLTAPPAALCSRCTETIACRTNIAQAPQSMSDIFLSHATLDLPVARRVANALKNAGFDIWFDEQQLKPGPPISIVIENALDAAKSMVALLSPAYFASEWTKKERSTITFRDPANSRSSMIPVLIGDCEIPTALKMIGPIDLRECTEESLAQLVDKVSEVIGMPVKTKPQADVGFADDSAAATTARMASELLPAYEWVVERWHASRKCALLFFDIDGFTHVNARHGVETGERVINFVQEALMAGVPPSAEVLRWRADEFVAFLPELDEREALRVGKELVRKIAERHWASTKSGLFVTISCGVSVRTKNSRVEHVEWIETAILGARDAKMMGGGQARVGSKLEATSRRRGRRSADPVRYLVENYGSPSHYA